MILVTCVLFLLAATASAQNLNVEDACPSDAVKTVGKKYFEVRGDLCYLFMLYDEVVFDQARGKCNSSGGTLAMPKTKELNDFLLEELKGFGHSKALWIGMHDTVEEGKMVWEDGTDVDDWGNFDWANGGFFGGGEDCVALHPRDGKWHDYGCFQTGLLSRISFPTTGNAVLPFICQYPVNKDAGTSDQGDDDTAGTTDQAGDDGSAAKDQPGGDGTTGTKNAAVDDTNGTKDAAVNDTTGTKDAGVDDTTGNTAADDTTDAVVDDTNGTKDAAVNDTTGTKDAGVDDTTGNTAADDTTDAVVDDTNGTKAAAVNNTTGTKDTGVDDTTGTKDAVEDDNTGTPGTAGADPSATGK